MDDEPPNWLHSPIGGQKTWGRTPVSNRRKTEGEKKPHLILLVGKPLEGEKNMPILMANIDIENDRLVAFCDGDFIPDNTIKPTNKDSQRLHISSKDNNGTTGVIVPIGAESIIFKGCYAQETYDDKLVNCKLVSVKERPSDIVRNQIKTSTLYTRMEMTCPILISTRRIKALEPIAIKKGSKRGVGINYNSGKYYIKPNKKNAATPIIKNRLSEISDTIPSDTEDFVVRVHQVDLTKSTSAKAQKNVTANESIDDATLAVLALGEDKSETLQAPALLPQPSTPLKSVASSQDPVSQIGTWRPANFASIMPPSSTTSNLVPSPTNPLQRRGDESEGEEEGEDFSDFLTKAPVNAPVTIEDIWGKDNDVSKTDTILPEEFPEFEIEDPTGHRPRSSSLFGESSDDERPVAISTPLDVSDTEGETPKSGYDGNITRELMMKTALEDSLSLFEPVTITIGDVLQPVSGPPPISTPADVSVPPNVPESPTSEITKGFKQITFNTPEAKESQPSQIITQSPQKPDSQTDELTAALLKAIDNLKEPRDVTIQVSTGNQQGGVTIPPGKVEEPTRAMVQTQEVLEIAKAILESVPKPDTTIITQIDIETGQLHELILEILGRTIKPIDIEKDKEIISNVESKLSVMSTNYKNDTNYAIYIKNILVDATIHETKTTNKNYGKFETKTIVIGGRDVGNYNNRISNLNNFHTWISGTNMSGITEEDVRSLQADIIRLSNLLDVVNKPPDAADSKPLDNLQILTAEIFAIGVAEKLANKHKGVYGILEGANDATNAQLNNTYSIDKEVLHKFESARICMKYGVAPNRRIDSFVDCMMLILEKLNEDLLYVNAKQQPANRIPLGIPDKRLTTGSGIPETNAIVPFMESLIENPQKKLIATIRTLSDLFIDTIKKRYPNDFLKVKINVSFYKNILSSVDNLMINRITGTNLTVIIASLEKLNILRHFYALYNLVVDNIALADVEIPIYKIKEEVLESIQKYDIYLKSVSGFAPESAIELSDTDKSVTDDEKLLSNKKKRSVRKKLILETVEEEKEGKKEEIKVVEKTRKSTTHRLETSSESNYRIAMDMFKEASKNKGIKPNVSLEEMEFIIEHLPADVADNFTIINCNSKNGCSTILLAQMLKPKKIFSFMESDKVFKEIKTVDTLIKDSTIVEIKDRSSIKIPTSEIKGDLIVVMIEPSPQHKKAGSSVIKDLIKDYRPLHIYYIAESRSKTTENYESYELYESKVGNKKALHYSLKKRTKEDVVVPDPDPITEEENPHDPVPVAEVVNPSDTAPIVEAAIIPAPLLFTEEVIQDVKADLEQADIIHTETRIRHWERTTSMPSRLDLFKNRFEKIFGIMTSIASPVNTLILDWDIVRIMYEYMLNPIYPNFIDFSDRSGSTAIALALIFGCDRVYTILDNPQNFDDKVEAIDLLLKLSDGEPNEIPLRDRFINLSDDPREWEFVTSSSNYYVTMLREPDDESNELHTTFMRNFSPLCSFVIQNDSTLHTFADYIRSYVGIGVGEHAKRNLVMQTVITDSMRRYEELQQYMIRPDNDKHIYKKLIARNSPRGILPFPTKDYNRIENPNVRERTRKFINSLFFRALSNKNINHVAIFGVKYGDMNVIMDENLVGDRESTVHIYIIETDGRICSKIRQSLNYYNQYHIQRKFIQFHLIQKMPGDVSNTDLIAPDSKIDLIVNYTLDIFGIGSFSPFIIKKLNKELLSDTVIYYPEKYTCYGFLIYNPSMGQQAKLMHNTPNPIYDKMMKVDWKKTFITWNGVKVSNEVKVFEINMSSYDESVAQNYNIDCPEAKLTTSNPRPHGLMLYDTFTMPKQDHLAPDVRGGRDPTIPFTIFEENISPPRFMSDMHQNVYIPLDFEAKEANKEMYLSMGFDELQKQTNDDIILKCSFKLTGAKSDDIVKIGTTNLNLMSKYDYPSENIESKEYVIGYNQLTKTTKKSRRQLNVDNWSKERIIFNRGPRKGTNLFQGSLYHHQNRKKKTPFDYIGVYFPDKDGIEDFVEVDDAIIKRMLEQDNKLLDDIRVPQVPLWHEYIEDVVLEEKLADEKEEITNKELSEDDEVDRPIKKLRGGIRPQEVKVKLIGITKKKRNSKPSNVINESEIPEKKIVHETESDIAPPEKIKKKIKLGVIKKGLNYPENVLKKALFESKQMLKTKKLLTKSKYASYKGCYRKHDKMGIFAFDDIKKGEIIGDPISGKITKSRDIKDDANLFAVFHVDDENVIECDGIDNMAISAMDFQESTTKRGNNAELVYNESKDIVEMRATREIAQDEEIGLKKYRFDALGRIYIDRGFFARSIIKSTVIAKILKAGFVFHLLIDTDLRCSVDVVSVVKNPGTEAVYINKTNDSVHPWDRSRIVYFLVCMYESIAGARGPFRKYLDVIKGSDVVLKELRAVRENLTLVYKKISTDTTEKYVLNDERLRAMVFLVNLMQYFITRESDIIIGAIPDKQINSNLDGLMETTVSLGNIHADIANALFSITTENTAHEIDNINRHVDGIYPKFARCLGDCCRYIMNLFRLLYHRDELPQKMVDYFDAYQSRSTEIEVYSMAKKSNSDEVSSRIKIDFEMNVTHYEIPYSKEYEEISHEFEIYLPKSVVPHGYSKFVSGTKIKGSIESPCLADLDPKTSVLGIRLYQVIKPTDDDGKKFSYTRRDPIGDALIPLNTLATKKNVDLVITDMSFPKKSYMNVSIRWNTTNFSLENANFNEHAFLGDDLENDLASKISDFFDFYTRVEPYRKELRRIHVPRYPTNSVMLPASMFASETFTVSRESESEPFLTKLIRCSLLLNIMQENTYLDTIKKQFKSSEPRLEFGFKSCIKVMCESTTIFANVCDYKSDISNGKICERFISVFKTYMGDCEDLGSSIKCIASSIQENRWSEKDEPLLYWTSKLMNLFIPFMMIGAVSNPAFRRNSNDSNEFICHSFAMLQPRLWCANAYNIPESMRKIVAPERYPWEHLVQDILTLEGTNFVNPYVLPNKIMFDLDEVKAYISKNDEYIKLRVESICKKYKSFGSTLVEANHPASSCNIEELRKQGIPFSGFYKNIINIWTDFFATRGYMVTDFTACIRKDKGMFYGPPYDQFIMKSDKITMEPTFKITTKEWFDYLLIINQQPPFCMPRAAEDGTNIIDRLELIKNQYPVKESTLLHMVDLKIENVGQMVGAVSPPYVAFRLNHVSKITSNLLKEIRALLGDQSFGFNGFDYIYQPLIADSDVCIIEIRFFK
jgi:hypothetical protein